VREGGGQREREREREKERGRERERLREETVVYLCPGQSNTWAWLRAHSRNLGVEAPEWQCKHILQHQQNQLRWSRVPTRKAHTHGQQLPGDVYVPNVQIQGSIASSSMRHLYMQLGHVAIVHSSTYVAVGYTIGDMSREMWTWSRMYTHSAPKRGADYVNRWLSGMATYT
jgi:hypothetical protein